MGDGRLEAVELQMLELAIAISVADKDWEGRAYTHLGNAYFNLPDYKQAIEHYAQALHIFKEIGCRVGQGAASCNLGHAYCSIGNYKQAIEYHEKYLSIAKEVGDRAWEGLAYGSLGTVYFRLGNFKQGIELCEKHLTIAKEVEDRALEGLAYGNLGNAHCNLGNFQQAIEYCEKLLNIAKEAGNKAWEGKGYGNLGRAYRGLGNFKQAIECFENSLSIAKEVGDKVEEGNALGNLGNAYNTLGNSKQAIEFCEKHLSIAKKVGDRAGEGLGYGILGNAHCSLGNFREAIEYYEKHLTIAKEVGDKVGERRAYGALGTAYLKLGNFNKQTIEYCEKNLSIAIEIGDRDGEGLAYGKLGVVYCRQRKFKQAIEHYEKHLIIAKEVRNRTSEGSAYGNLGKAYLSLGNFKQAVEYFKQHLSIAKEVGDRASEGSAYGGLGISYLNLGNFKEAMECHEHSLSIFKEIGDCLEEGVAWFMLGHHHKLLGSLSNALNCYRLSIKYFDETRHSLKSKDEWKISFRHSLRASYTTLWRTLLMNGEIEEALYAAEKGRAQALMDILKEQYGIDSQSFSAFAPKQTLSAALELLPSQAVFVALDENKITFWVLRKASKINFRQKEITSGSADLLMEPVLKGIGIGDRVRCEDRSLDPLRSDLSCSRTPSEETVQPSLPSVNSLQPLCDLLLGPIADLLQGDELIVVPDGPFCLAPYSALSESIRIRTVPSLSAFNVIVGASEDFHVKTGALLVGDPWLKEVINEKGEPIFTQLPCAKEEVEMIGELMQTTPLIERNATKAEVLKRMKSVALVHIAAHGCPTTGEIALAPNTERKSPIPKDDDYILKMSEVQAISLRARLVVLSCCHSGRGEVMSEGVVGIARAFLCAGARSVLVSLWAIDDEVTLLFMRSFYQHLVDGKSASAALQQAMKSLRGLKQYRAIKHWVPFVLVGDDVTLEFPKNGKWIYIYIYYTQTIVCDK